MRSSILLPTSSGSASQYNNLRLDAFGASQLLAHQQASPNMTLAVESGVCYISNVQVNFAGGNTPTVTAPVSNPRIDLLTLDNTGTLAWVVGSEGVSPAVPTYPTNKLVLCELYNKVGETTLLDATSGGSGYIQKDSRPVLSLSYIGNANQLAAGVVADAALASTFVKTSGNQNVSGVKTFSSLPAITSDPASGNDAVRKSYVDNLATVSSSSAGGISYYKQGKLYFGFYANLGAGGGNTGFYYDSNTYNQIASILGISVSNVYTSRQYDVGVNGAILNQWNGSAWVFVYASGVETTVTGILST